MEGDHVGAGIELVEALRPLDPELAEAFRGHELVEGNNLHVECQGALGDQLADAAEADDAERLAVELVAAVP